MNLISTIAITALYCTAGIFHFIKPTVFLKITPPWVPFPRIVNYGVGLIEIILGLGIGYPPTQPIAAMGIIVLLILVFPANVYHFQKSYKKKKYTWLTLLRLPLQFVLIYWAYTYL